MSEGNGFLVIFADGLSLPLSLWHSQAFPWGVMKAPQDIGKGWDVAEKIADRLRQQRLREEQERQEGWKDLGKKQAN